MTLERLELSGELALDPEVVGIDERDEVGAQDLETAVARRRRPAALLTPDERAATGVASLERDRRGRAVVDDDDLLGRPVVLEHRIERRGEERGFAVDGDDCPHRRG